jgi:RNA ligase (TIGR02306 family)
MKLVSLETILDISDISGADKIELATVQGWQSVVKKNEYKVGDRIVFVPIDTVLEPREWNKFLWDKNDPSKSIRIKNVTLRGVCSQGVIFPLSIISEFTGTEEELPEFLGVTKYEKPIPSHLAGQVAGDFPSRFVSKTDEDNLKSNIECFEELKNTKRVIATLKIDGTSATYIKELDGTFRVCSRKQELKETESNVHWQMARKYNLREVMKNGTCIQGEIAGPGIQSNPAGLTAVELFIFNYKDLQTNRYVNVMSKENLQELKLYGLQTVPELFELTQSAFSYESLKSLQDYTNTLIYSNKKQAEGMVLRGLNEDGNLVFSKHLNKMLSVKLINQNYKD